MASAVRASGRKRAQGVNKAKRKLESRRHEWDRLAATDKPAYRYPGTEKKLD